MSGICVANEEIILPKTVTNQGKPLLLTTRGSGKSHIFICESQELAREFFMRHYQSLLIAVDIT